jgi:hypothetical protein
MFIQWSVYVMLDYSFPWMYRSFKIVKLEQVFKLYRIMFQELKEKKKQLPSYCFCNKKNKTLEKY